MSDAEGHRLVAKLEGCTTLPGWAQTPISPAEAAILLRVIAERDVLADRLSRGGTS